MPLVHQPPPAYVPPAEPGPAAYPPPPPAQPGPSAHAPAEPGPTAYAPVANQAPPAEPGEPGEPVAVGEPGAPDGPVPDARPIRSHRRREPRVLRRRIGAALAIIATLAVGGLITDHVPDVDTRQEPFVRTGSIGTLVDGRSFDASVLSVRGAAVVDDPAPDPDSGASTARDTSGVWVLVRIRLVAIGKPASLSYAAVVDAKGRTYRATSRFHQPLVESGYTLQPGVPVSGDVAFEVPTAVATQLSVQLAAPTIATDVRLDSVVEVPLPEDAATVRRWKAQTKPATLQAPTVVQ